MSGPVRVPGVVAGVVLGVVPRLTGLVGRVTVLSVVVVVAPPSVAARLPPQDSNFKGAKGLVRGL